MNFFWKQHGFQFSHPVYLAVDQTSNISSESNVEKNSLQSIVVYWFYNIWVLLSQETEK